ncbi:MAG: hypothetical protein GY938_13435 [Ketobacter sp.]|nr:hypothetical protein [Ketobacter sp.]
MTNRMTKSPEERASIICHAYKYTICRAYKYTSGHVQKLIAAHIKEAEEAARQEENEGCIAGCEEMLDVYLNHEVDPEYIKGVRRCIKQIRDWREVR